MATKPTVYIETTVISYLTARPTRDPIVLGWIAATREWWEESRSRFNLFASELVYDEASAGDSKAALARVEKLTGIPNLKISAAAENLAEELLKRAALPVKARRDALHLGISATNGIDYLLTWNCRHLANASLRRKIMDVCHANGLEPPTICTPLELMEVFL